MNRREHYLKAEEYVRSAERAWSASDEEAARVLAAIAQVHVGLATVPASIGARSAQ